MLRVRLDLRLMLALLLAICVGCTGGADTDLVLYKAPITRIEGRPYSRVLAVLGTLSALGIRQAPSGDLDVREGAVSREDWDALRVDLSATTHLRPDAVEGGGLLRYQIVASLGKGEISLRRAVEEPVAKELASARERLEAVWEALPVAEDPVGALERWAGSGLGKVRGLATQGLLVARTSPSISERGQERADLIVHGRLEVERDAGIRKMIQESLKDVSERYPGK